MDMQNLKQQAMDYISNPMGIFGDAMAIHGLVSGYKDARQKGDNAFVAGAKSVGQFAYNEMYYTALNTGISKVSGAMGLTGGKGFLFNMAAQAAIAGTQAAASVLPTVWGNTAQKQTKGFAKRGGIGSGHFDMNQAGYTMRQRSLNAIQSNGLNTRSVLGNEARNFVMSSL